MPKRPRKTLTSYFEEGALPLPAHFADLVESSLNVLDDGFSRSAENGIEIALIGQQSRFISFFRDNPDDRQPDWTISSQPHSGALNFSHISAPTQDATAASANSGQAPSQNEDEILTLSSDRRVGINSPQPEYELDVNGAIRSDGRFGKTGKAKADGQWQTIGDPDQPLDGCQAFEIVAGVGLRKTGRYALLHAIAMNTWHPTGFFLNFLNRNRKIRSTQAWYLSRADRLRLRWIQAEKVKSSAKGILMNSGASSADKPEGPTHQYFLQIKTERSYLDETADDVFIQYSITRLWFDPYMTKCRQPGGAQTP